MTALRAELTPAEAFVLLDPKRASPAEAFKIGLLWLVAQGVLRIRTEERKILWRLRQVPLVSVVRPPPERLLAAEISGIVSQAMKSADNAGLKAVALAASNEFGSGLMKIKTQYLLPALIQRGLVTVEHSRFLGLFRTVTYSHTPTGLAEKRQIENTLAQARRLPELLQSDQDEVRAVLLAAGALILLVPELKGYYKRFGMLNPSDGDTTAMSFADSGGDFDFGDLFDCSAFDMDFSSFDASFDSSFGDSGGDGGGDSGGDGGGGGE